MLFGVCSSYENAEFIKSVGYDYIELPLAAVASYSEEEFEKCYEALKKADIKALAFNCFFPGDIKLVGPEMDLHIIEEYAEKAILRAAKLGAETLVLGSGRSRNIDEAYDEQICEKQFAEVLKVIGAKAKKYGITIVIEPLNKNETNLINTVPQAIEFVKLAGCENVKALVDFYHFSLENEPDCDITDFKEGIAHVHLARGKADRGVPNTEDIAYLEKWSNLLKQIGYNNKISIEAAYKDFKSEISDAKKLLAVFEN